MAAHFTAEPEFRNSTSVDADTYGDPDEAGFVQVMQGRTNDPARGRELMASDPTDWQAFRPDILGTVRSDHEGGEWTMAIYFTLRGRRPRGREEGAARRAAGR